MTAHDENKKATRIFRYDEWLPWEQNASPLLLVQTLNAGMRNLNDYFGNPLWTTIIIFENDQGKWLFRPKELKMLGQKMIDFLMCPPYRVLFMTGYEEMEKNLLNQSQLIQFNTDLAELTNHDLIRLFDSFSQIYYDWYKYGWFCEPIQFQSQDILIPCLENEAKEKTAEIDIENLKNAIFAVEGDTFAIEILNHSLECVRAFAKVMENNIIANQIQAISKKSDFPKKAAQIILSAIKNEGNSDEDLKTLYEKLIEHSKLYYWKRNNYFSTQFLNEKEILIELLASDTFDISDPVSSVEKELQNIDDNKKTTLIKKRDLLEMLPPYEKNIAILASSMGALIDRRKKSIMIANSAFDRIIQEVADRTKTDINTCRLLIPQELSYFLMTPEEYHERLAERRKLFVVYQGQFPMLDDLFAGIDQENKVTSLNSEDFAMKDPFIAEGNYAENILNQLNSRLNFMVSSNVKAFDIVQGVAIYYDKSQPILTGKVRIIRNPKSEILENDEILVAPSTTPDYMDAIRRSKAIITDWGGQTSHAAITSRELRKPCIIGTNYASQVLKNGDKIQIDFNKGKIEIIDRK